MNTRSPSSAGRSGSRGVSRSTIRFCLAGSLLVMLLSLPSASSGGGTENWVLIGWQGGGRFLKTPMPAKSFSDAHVGPDFARYVEVANRPGPRWFAHVNYGFMATQQRLMVEMTVLGLYYGPHEAGTFYRAGLPVGSWDGTIDADGRDLIEGNYHTVPRRDVDPVQWAAVGAWR
jgi:hypothetical protein